MQFQLLIPTYNRCNDLKQNLEKIYGQLTSGNLAETVGIAVSDNASTDDTWQMLTEMKRRWEGKIRLDIIRNESNVGLEQNVVNLLAFATSEYIIWLGDDDFLAEGYLSFIQQQFSTGAFTWMIPGLIGVDKEGNQIEGRPVVFPYKSFEGGYETVNAWSHLAHQMSGLVVKRAGLLETYTSYPQWRNPYLFIFFTAWCQLHGAGIYAPSYQTLINNYNPKAWGYNKIGLLDEVFKSYYYLKKEIGQARLNQLLLRFIVMHSYRIEFSKGLMYTLRQGKWILQSADEAQGLKWPLYKLLVKEYIIRKLGRAA